MDAFAVIEAVFSTTNGEPPQLCGSRDSSGAKMSTDRLFPVGQLGGAAAPPGPELIGSNPRTKYSPDYDGVL